MEDEKNIIHSDDMDKIREWMGKPNKWNPEKNIDDFNELLEYIGGADFQWLEKLGLWDVRIYVGPYFGKYSEWGDTPADAVVICVLCYLRNIKKNES